MEKLQLDRASLDLFMDSSIESALVKYFGFLNWKMEVTRVNELETFVHLDFENFKDIGSLNWDSLFQGARARVSYIGKDSWIVRYHAFKLSKSVGILTRVHFIDQFYHDYFSKVTRFVPCDCTGKSLLDFKGIKYCPKCKLIFDIKLCELVSHSIAKS